LRNHASSTLLRLPGELRNRIYEHNFHGANWLLRRGGRIEDDKKQLSVLRVCRQLNHETSLLPFALAKMCTYVPNVFQFIDRLTLRQNDAIRIFQLYLHIGKTGVQLGDNRLCKQYLEQLGRFRKLRTLEVYIRLSRDADDVENAVRLEKAKQEIGSWLWFEDKPGLRLELHVDSFKGKERSRTWMPVKIFETVGPN